MVVGNDECAVRQLETSQAELTYVGRSSAIVAEAITLLKELANAAGAQPKPVDDKSDEGANAFEAPPKSVDDKCDEGANVSDAPPKPVEDKSDGNEEANASDAELALGDDERDEEANNTAEDKTDAEKNMTVNAAGADAPAGGSD